MARHRLQFAYTVAKADVKVEEQVLIHHKRLRSDWLGYLLDARPAVVLTAPVIYLTIIPFVLLDLGVRVYRIPIVNRRNYLLFDRRELGYAPGRPSHRRSIKCSGSPRFSINCSTRAGGTMSIG
jgi:hypothetical protein